MNYSQVFSRIRELCSGGSAVDIDRVMAYLNDEVELPVTKAVDFYLGMVSNPEGIGRIEYHLFNGTPIRRNFATLFFARRNDWHLVNEAVRLGLVDHTQAYSR